MKKPTVDYSEFKLSRINDPRFSHLKLLLGWVGYFLLYFITENFIKREDCYPVHCALDDVIVFNEWFVIPYVFWYLLIAGTLAYYAFYNVDNFKKLMTYIIVTQVVAMSIYILFPNRQDLRPIEFPRDNILTDIVGFLYSFDTSTNVCPSLHVAYSLGIASVWLKDRDASLAWKMFIVIVVILICLSVVFIKQHSVVDIFAALPVCLLAEGIAFGKSYYKKRFKKDEAAA